MSSISILDYPFPSPIPGVPTPPNFWDFNWSVTIHTPVGKTRTTKPTHQHHSKDTESGLRTRESCGDRFVRGSLRSTERTVDGQYSVGILPRVLSYKVKEKTSVCIT